MCYVGLAAHSTNIPSLIDYQPGDMLLLTSSPGQVESEVLHSPVYTVPVHFSPQLVPQHQTGPYENLAAVLPKLDIITSNFS